MIKKILGGGLLRLDNHWTRLAFSVESRARVRLSNLLGAKIDASAAFTPLEVDGEWRWLSIGEEAAVGRCSLQLLAPLSIGRRAIINNGVRLLTGQHSLSDPGFALTTAPITIEEYAWVATNAMLLPGVTIGRGAVVAAGAVVTRNVAPNDIVGGNPAKVIGQRTSPYLEYVPGMVAFISQR